MRRRDRRFKTEDEDLPFEHTDVATNQPKMRNLRHARRDPLAAKGRR